MKEKKISIGSVVKIKGQDVKMTVEDIIKPSLEESLWSNVSENKIQTKVNCVWFVNQQLYRDTFKINSLTLI